MLPIPKIRELLKAEREKLPIELAYYIDLLCDYAERWDAEISEKVKAAMIFNFRLKDTNRKVKAINYEERCFELTD